MHVTGLRDHLQSKCGVCRVHFDELVPPQATGFRVCFQQAMAHDVNGQVLSEFHPWTSEIFIELFKATQIQTLVERMAQQTLNTQTITKEFLECVPPTEKERILWLGGQTPTFHEILASQRFRAIGRMEENTGGFLIASNGIPAKIIQTSTDQNVDIKPNSTIAAEDTQSHSIWSSLMWSHIHEAVWQLFFWKVLENCGLLKNSDIPMGIDPLPGANTHLKELGHLLMALCPVGPNCARFHLATSQRCRGWGSCWNWSDRCRDRDWCFGIFIYTSST